MPVEFVEEGNACIGAAMAVIDRSKKVNNDQCYQFIYELLQGFFFIDFQHLVLYDLFLVESSTHQCRVNSTDLNQN